MTTAKKRTEREGELWVSEEMTRANRGSAMWDGLQEAVNRIMPAHNATMHGVTMHDVDLLNLVCDDVSEDRAAAQSAASRGTDMNDIEKEVRKARGDAWWVVGWGGGGTGV